MEGKCLGYDPSPRKGFDQRSRPGHYVIICPNGTLATRHYVPIENVISSTSPFQVPAASYIKS